MYVGQSCQMVYFQTKDPNLGKFWRAFHWKVLVYFLAFWHICWLFLGTYFTVLVYCTKKNLATLMYIRTRPSYFRQKIYLRFHMP
jgi:hypothetical protein